MANFDSVTKRFSGMGMGLDEAPLLPKPDGTIAQGDRQHFLDGYSGIAWSNPSFKAFWARFANPPVIGALPSQGGWGA